MPKSLEQKFPNIQGLTIIEDFISLEEEKDLIENITRSEWNTSLKRRTQHYGYEYKYDRKSVAVKVNEIPHWCFGVQKVIEDVVKGTGFQGNGSLKKIETNGEIEIEKKEEENVKFDQLIINEYEPGQGIAPHIDNQKLFENTVASLSLSSATVMIFSKGEQKEEVWLERRSLLIIQGEARNLWKHSIANRLSDRGLKRKVRYSLTFRQMKSSEVSNMEPIESVKREIDSEENE